MRVIERIPVAWTPYAVTFSHDGTRLAIGGGGWYGLGGITMIDLRSNERVDLAAGTLDREAFEGTQLAPPVAAIANTEFQGGTISSLAFTSDDRHLFAGVWLSGHRGGRALALEVDGLQLRSIARHIAPHHHAITGLSIHRRRAVLRQWRAPTSETIRIADWTAHEDIDPSPARSELTSQRIVVSNAHMLTGDHGVQRTTQHEPSGLIIGSFGAGGTPAVHTKHVVTAIGTTGPLVITGNELGELEARRWDDRLVLDHVIGTIPSSEPGPRSHYKPAAVSGICALADGRGAAVTGGRTLATWANRELACWPIDGIGSPRSLAASPDRSLVAIGLKDVRDARPESSVVLVDLETDDVMPWRTDRTRDAARAVDRQPDGTLDPNALAVLADALDEQGCDPRVLHHLRTHDRRLRTCWVLEQLSR